MLHECLIAISVLSKQLVSMSSSTAHSLLLVWWLPCVHYVVEGEQAANERMVLQQQLRERQQAHARLCKRLWRAQRSPCSSKATRRPQQELATSNQQNQELQQRCAAVAEALELEKGC